MSTASPEREKLAAAIAAKNAALGNAARAEELLRNANGVLSELLAKRREHDGLDDEISAARAAKTVKAIQHGESPVVETPSGFASRLTAREQVDAELAAVKGAIPLLESQLAEARRHVEDCTYAIDVAAETVLSAELEALATDYMQKLLEVREMAYRLHYLATRQVHRDQRNATSNNPGLHYISQGPTRPISVSKAISEALRESPLGDYEIKKGIRLREGTVKNASDYWTRLHDDADAQYEVYTVPPPFDADALLAKVRA